MNVERRLTSLLRRSTRIAFNDSSKFVLFSDCHRGDGSAADSFEPNAELYLSVLAHYKERGFTYIELGDGDELWKNVRLSKVRDAHAKVFALLEELSDENRMHMIYGNHDLAKKWKGVVRSLIGNSEISARRQHRHPLRAHQALVLEHEETQRRIMLVHGHQGDPLADQLWMLGWFVVRFLLRPLELMGYKDPSSVSQLPKQRDALEERMISWSRTSGCTLCAGHTHIWRFPEREEAPYYNTGCCIVRGLLTGFEIVHGTIVPVKWYREPEGRIRREAVTH